MKKQIFLTLSFLGLATSVAPAMAGQASFTVEGIPENVHIYVKIPDLPVAHTFGPIRGTEIVPLDFTPPPGATPSVYIGDPDAGGVLQAIGDYQDADRNGNFAWYIKQEKDGRWRCIVKGYGSE